MKQIKVDLLHISPLHIASKAIRKCHANEYLSDTNFDIPEPLYGAHLEYGITHTPKLGTKDRNLIHRVGLKHDHSSTLEHITASFDITGISVAVLGQLTRHRLASYTVQSTRYTTDKLLKNEVPFTNEDDMVVYKNAVDRANKYIVFVNDQEVNHANTKALEYCRRLSAHSVHNDELRYALPQAWRTNLTMTINFRSLRNFLQLRTSSHAMEEIRHLANLIYQSIPGEYHYLLEDCVVESNTDL